MKLLAFALLLCLTSPAQSALVDEPGDASQWRSQALTLYAQKQYDAALAAFTRSLKLDNHSPAAYQGVGNCYLAKGDRPEAVKYYGYALQLAPDNAQLRAYVAKLVSTASQPPPPNNDIFAANQSYREHRYDEAIEAYRQASDANPRFAKAWQGMGNCYFAKGDKPMALSCYRKSMDLDPANAALANFVAAYAASSDSDKPRANGQGGGGWIQPAWRSIILPGWGQAYNGQAGKGVFLGGLTFALIAGEVATYVMGSNARNQYLQASGANTDYDTPYNTWSSMANLNHLFYIGSTLAYTYTLLDAVFESKTQLPGQGPVQTGLAEPSLRLALLPGGVGIRAKLLAF